MTEGFYFSYVGLFLSISLLSSFFSFVLSFAFLVECLSDDAAAAAAAAGVVCVCVVCECVRVIVA